MPYPFSKSGGLSSVAWGDITGTLSAQTDLQSAIDSAGGGSVAWGDITGTLSDQTDLQLELDSLAGLSWVNKTNDTFWTSNAVDTEYVWSGSEWEREGLSTGEFDGARLVPTGGWASGYRPEKIRLTLNSGNDEGGLLGSSVFFTLWDGDGTEGPYNSIALSFESWNQTKVFEMDLADLVEDIHSFMLSGVHENTGPIINLIEFQELAP